MRRIFLLILGLFVFSCDGSDTDCPSGVYDCAGVCDGTATEEDCDACDGAGLNEHGCCGDAQPDECDVCDGSGPIVEGYDCNCNWDGITTPSTSAMSDNTLYISSSGDVLYSSIEDIAGFQFDVNGATVSGASGGDAAAVGFTVSAGGSTVLGF